MFHNRKTISSWIAAILGICRIFNPLSADESLHTQYEQKQKVSALEPLGFSLSGSWADPWPHRHFSTRNTPLIHSFGIEPAFLDRDLFLDTQFSSSEDGDELELEAEVEWALTRRIGMVFELPYAVMNPDTGKKVNGIGDLAIAPRFLLGETDRLKLSANMEVAFPSGGEDRDLGSGEFGLAPSISGWVDLGNWFSAGIQLGTEHGLASEDKEFFYGLALGYTFLTLPTHESEMHHFPPGMANLIFEWTGRSGFNGDEPHTSEVLLGASYNVSGNWEFRGGYQFPVGKNSILNKGYLLGVIYHF